MMRLNHIEEVLKKKLHSPKDKPILEARIILKANTISNMIKSTQMIAMKASTTSTKRWAEKTMEVNIDPSNDLYIKKRNLTVTSMMRDSKNYKNLIASLISKEANTNKV